LTDFTVTQCYGVTRKDKDEANQRKVSFFFSSTFRPFVKTHPYITHHVLQVRFSTLLSIGFLSLLLAAAACGKDLSGQ
jgi:hypothetical protein